ncbi:MAG: hypothetical protein ACRD4O_07375 [Bryobacteraceae bacterium]
MTSTFIQTDACFRGLNPLGLQLTFRVNLNRGLSVAQLEQYQLFLCSNRRLSCRF